MKLRHIILSAILMLYSIGINAQTSKRYDHVVKLNIPSFIYYNYPPFDVPRSFEATATSKYYYDEDDNKILDGPVKIVGGYTKPAVRTPATSFGEYASSINITANAKDGVLEGAWNGIYKESQSSGKKTLTYDLSLKTTFKDGAMTGSFLMTSNLKRNGNDDKSLMDVKMDEYSNLKSINQVLGDKNWKITFDEEGNASGSFSSNDIKFSVYKNVILEFFNRKTGELCECEEEQTEILTRYSRGECTLDDIMKAGYILKKFEDVRFGVNSDLLRCLNLGESELGAFGDISFPLYILTRADVLSLEELIPLLQPDENTDPIDWDPTYDETTGILEYNQGYYSGIQQYVAPSVAKEFLFMADSIQRMESIEISKLVFKNAGNHVNIGEFPQQYAFNRELYWHIDEDAYNMISSTKVGSFSAREIIKDPDISGYVVIGTLDANIDHKDGPVVFEVITNICIANYGRAYSVKLLEANKISSCWDTYREKKATIYKALRTIDSNSAKYDEASFTAFKTFCKSYDMNAKSSYDESMEALTSFEPIIDNFKEFGSIQKQVISQNDKLAAQLQRYPEILNSYNAQFSSLDLTWAPNKDHNKLNEASEIIIRTERFLAKRDEVEANDTKIKEVGANGKYTYNAYIKFISESSLSLPDDANTGDLESIITVQKETYAILTDPAIKDIEKKVKKAKLSDINDIILFINQNYTPVTTSIEAEVETKATETKNEVSEYSKATKTVTAAKERKIKESGSKNGGYGQYVDLTGLWDFQDNGSGVSVNVNYIGGYRFNKNIFLGLGTGISINDQNGNYYEHKTTSASGTELGYDITYFPHSFMSIPIYLHFRTDFGKGNRSWNPYISLSAGYHMSIAPIGSAVPGDFWEDWDKITEDMPEYREITNTSNGGLMGEVNFGMNCRLNEKMGMYFGIGFRAESRKESLDISTGGASGNGAVPAYSTRLSIGLSF